MSVIDLNELVKLLEKKFGVSAAAAASAAPAAELFLPQTLEVSSMYTSSLSVNKDRCYQGSQEFWLSASKKPRI